MSQETLSSLKPLPSSSRRRGRGWKVVGGLFVVVIVVVAVLALWLRHRVEASLPVTTGELRIEGLAAPVTIERDALGTPTIHAGSRLDAARALGFLHGQDRLFQMDLLRRLAAGELAEIFGKAALPGDQAQRYHRFRATAQAAVAQATSEEKALLEAYAAGVNAGAKALGDKPFEYILLRADVAPWKPEDTFLAMYTMCITLSDEEGGYEAGQTALHAEVPQALYDFLEPAGTEWDAPLVGPVHADLQIPGPDVFDMRKRPQKEQPKKGPSHPIVSSLQPIGFPALPEPVAGELAATRQELRSMIGSNAWAVAGSHTADGKALVANDMHLAMGLPTTWYRAVWTWPEGGVTKRSAGVTLPGTPMLIVGSTGHVAWGFTNTFGDWTDRVALELDPKDPEVYRTPAGPKRFQHFDEVIHIHGEADAKLPMRWTIWGPVMDEDKNGKPLNATVWTPHFPESSNLRILGLESAKNVDEAIEVAHASGIPPQNFVVADDSGRIGWTVIGKVPRRVGFDGKFTTSWADGTRHWDGWLRSDEVPKVVDPPAGRIWSANNRMVDGPFLEQMGNQGYNFAARAHQIRDDLMALERATPADLLKIQLDDRAVFLERWRTVLLRLLASDSAKGDPKKAELKRLVETTWTGRASIESVAYRVVRGFHSVLAQQIFSDITGEEFLAPQPRFNTNGQFEAALWKLVSERPANFLDRRYKNWDEQMLAAVDYLLDLYEHQSGYPPPALSQQTWGNRNIVRFQHPLSPAVPLMGNWADLPPRPLPGDIDMPRVTSQTLNASERIVVSPGQEEKGIFHMPAGESGHPSSPHYRDGERAWEEGLPTPFLPGATVETLKLVPAGK
jgi:penicillin G amidase